MKHNTDRIRVSHAGNLPRPDDLDRLLKEHQTEAVRQRMPGAVAEVVQRQVECGVDIPNDAEYIKAGSYMAVAEVVREEYRAIAEGGLIVQVDEPEFATSWMFYSDWSVEEYRKHEEVVWAKLAASAEGARRASAQLWG